MTGRGARWRAILPAFALFLAHASIYGTWQIDDAGISFAYARNLGDGFGLVAQPGVPAVEGFSNPLWVGICALFSVAGIFYPLWTPKLLAVLAVFGIFICLDRTLGRAQVGASGSALALGLLAAQPAFVIWSLSGLENPIYVLAWVALLALALDRPLEGGQTVRTAVGAGISAAALALTRPEGIVFSALWPLVAAPGVIRATGASRLPKLHEMGRLVAAYAAAITLPVLAYLLFRRWYFGDWVPNTFYAKGGPTLASLVSVLSLGPAAARRGVELLQAAAGSLGSWLALGLFAATVYLLARRRLDQEVVILCTASVVGALPYLLLPLDWMPEFRFATPFFAVAPAAGIAVVAALPLRRRFQWALGLVVASSLVISVVPRIRTFAAHPTVPFAEVEARYGRDYNRYAAALGVEQGSFLLPDVGGALWTSRLRIYDLGGLCDRKLAHGIRFDRKELHEHVFGTLQPTFIRVHHYWAVRAQFDLDPRFARDYVPLWSIVDPWVQKRANASVPIRTGEFVRREVAERHPRMLEDIRHEIAAAR